LAFKESKVEFLEKREIKNWAFRKLRGELLENQEERLDSITYK